MTLQNTIIFNANAHSNNSLTIDFTDINITVMGDGEGGRIDLFNVSVNISTNGIGTSLSQLDNVRNYEVQLTDIVITDIWKKLQNNTNVDIVFVKANYCIAIYIMTTQGNNIIIYKVTRCRIPCID